MAKRLGGVIALKIGGELVRVKGAFDYGLGKPTREAIVGPDGVHGFKEERQAAFIEGTIQDADDVELETIADMTEVDVTLELSSGKVISLPAAWSTNPDGMKGNTEEGEVTVRFEAAKGFEV